MNTLQIIYYFPLLQFNYPLHYEMLLVYLRAANFNFPVPFESEYGTRLKKYFGIDTISES